MRHSVSTRVRNVDKSIVDYGGHENRDERIGEKEEERRRREKEEEQKEKRIFWRTSEL